MSKKAIPAGRVILLAAMILLFLPGVLIFGWYGLTHIPVRQTSEIMPRELDIPFGEEQCTLDIPAGTISISRPRQAAVGSVYHVDTEVRLEHPLRFIRCSGGLPNWNLALEAQTTLVGSNVQPFAAIRQPAFDREKFSFHWTFTPEEAVPDYQSHLWLRVIVSEQDQTVENWNLLVRDFPMRNVMPFGQPVLLWLIAGGFSLLTGILLLILFLQKRKKRSPSKTGTERLP